jgi:hypothetical protein
MMLSSVWGVCPIKSSICDKTRFPTFMEDIPTSVIMHYGRTFYVFSFIAVQLFWKIFSILNCKNLKLDFK